MSRRSSRKTAAAGASDVFIQRVRREISADQYVQSLDTRLSERRKANETAGKDTKSSSNGNARRES